MLSCLRIICQCFVERQLRAWGQICKAADACRYRNLKVFFKFSAQPPWNNQNQSKMGIIYLDSYAQSCMLESFGSLCHEGAFLAHIQVKKVENEAEVKNALGTTSCSKENTNKSINKCSTISLILFFHIGNWPEDGALQWVEEEVGWEAVLLLKCISEPAASASTSGYTWILLLETRRKCLTSRAISLVKPVLLMHRLKGCLLLYVFLCPS